MPSFLRALSCALLAGALLAPPVAEARFGKRSKSDKSSKKKKGDASSSSGGQVHDATPVREGSDSQPPVHDASPVGSGNPAPLPPPPPRNHYVPPPEPPPPYYVAPAPRAPSHEEREPERFHKLFTLGIEGQPLREGTSANLHLGLEVLRFGGFLRTSALRLRADDGSGEVDELNLTGVHLSYALFETRRWRLRAEGGVSVAKAPDILFVGPSVGLSSELYIFELLALEARAQVTPWPYRQLDASGGVALYFNWVSLRGGMRMLVLDDRGLVDGVVHRDELPGPYFGLGLAF